MAILLSVLGLVFLLQRVGCERLVNIALNKTPTQNGTLRYPKAGGPFFWNVSNSVDGRTDCTTPDYQTYSGTFEVDNPWWQLDLGSIYSIHAIHVLGRLDANNQLTGFRLWTGLEGDNLSISYRNTISDYNHGSIWINTSMTARVIKIDLPKDAVPKRPEPGPVVLCEVEVYVLSNDIIKTTSNVSMTNDIYHNYGANYSIDGKYPSAQSETPEACNCCSVAGGSQIPWWTIDFRIPRKIGGICITGRRDSFHWPQSKDLMILISNTSLTPTLWQSSEPIWTISESSPGYFFQHTFQEPIYFRYMTITTLMRRVMTICEVDFITTGCQPGSYGDNCSENCGFCNDSTNTCLVTNGTCPSGCLSGYDYRKDKTCKTECSDGHYGANCQDNCGKCAVSSNCSHYDGTCPADCAPGYNHTADNKCNTECSDGRYGPNCQGKCGHCALGSDCAHNDGRCSDGCSPGYNFTADNRCTIACSDGHYGADCQNNCGNCALGSNCSHYDGTCSGGCDPGYNYTADNRCNTECSDGRFGPNCQDKCGNCHLASDCSHKNGRCSDGCAPGYNYTADNRCIIACSGGHYGADCQNNCGNCALGSNCSHYDGTCPTGCAPGYRYTADNKCKTECSNGFYGMNCTETCGHCHNTTCSVADGICPDGCAPGFEYSANATCKQASSLPQMSNSSTPPIVGSVVGVVILVTAVVVLVVFLKRKRRLPKRNENRKEKRNEHAESDFVNLETLARGREKQTKKKEKEANRDQSHAENGGYYIFNPGDQVANNIKIRDLWNYITSNRANNFDDLFVEFQAVPGGVQYECFDAQRDENVGKNKYRNMYPYDHCRVKLKVLEGQTDYINASNVDGYERVKKFIAAQGPQKGTIEDFWLMVWQQGVRKVVMLTNVFEMGQDKCEQYWPNEGSSIQYGGIEVTSKETTEKSDYSIRKFDLRMEHEKLRRVEQFHFKSWPDKDVPDSTWCLVNFWRVAMNKDHGKYPIVVHCSAGIGRTGTFIALDSLYHQAMAEGGIRPVSVIETLRRQRINMVQTRYQYAFLHEAVADALLVGTHFFWASQLPSVCNFFMGRNPETSVTRAQEQFKLICECIKLSDKQEQASSSAAVDENIYEETGEPMVEPEYGNISTLQSEISEYRPKTKDRNSASIQQMNAIYLPNYAEASTYILAETPSESSLPEFWSLVEEQNVTTIVNLTETTHPNFKTSCTLGANGGKPVGQFVVNTVKEVKHKEYAIRSIVYKEQDKENNAGFTVKMFSLSAWQHGAECPGDFDPLMALLEEVNKWHPYVSEAKPVLFICGDGRTRCGLVAAILNETQRMRNEEGHVNIVETVMTIKKIAADVISSEQFQCLYEAVLAYALRIGYVLDTGDYNIVKTEKPL